MATAEGSTNADYSYNSDNYEDDDDDGDDDEDDVGGSKDQKSEEENQQDDKMDTHRAEAQRFIDAALREVNAGNYDKAIKLLDNAKSIYPDLQYEELQDLICKLRSHAHHERPHRAATPPPGLRQRRQSNSDGAGSAEYTIEQLELVKKINRCRNYYQVLSVSHEATDSDVKRAYKKLALQLHPDKNRAPGAAEAFKLVGTAVSILTDAQKRKDYDEAGANMISLQGGATNFSTTNFQRYSSHNMHQNTFEATFGQNDISAEELFNMFFGAFPTQRRRRTAFDSANQRAPDHHNFTEPSLAFGLILVIILISMLSSFFTSDPVYNLAQSSKYPIRRETQHLSVPYYVKTNFQSDYHGSMGRLENSVEEDFIYTMKQSCYRERSYRDAMMARARSFGSRAQFAQAQGLKMPSCDNLSKIEEIDDLIEKLKATQLNNATAISATNSETTTTLLNEISATKDPKLFDKHELAENFLILIKSDDTKVRKEAAKCIAEITKSEVQRKKFTTTEVIETFINCLRNLQDVTSMELPIQICRALGNICYLNDEARDIILQLKGDEILMELLDLLDIPDKDNALQFIKVRGGLISNYLLGGECLAKRAMDLQIMQKIEAIIAQCIDNGVKDQDEDLLLNTLPILSILTENVADLNFDAKLNIHLSRILAASTNPDLAEMCLELLHYQAENDEVKLLLAKDGLCETIYNLLEKYKMLASTSEARALMKLACELIVLILTGDESMHYLYATPLLKNMEDWLDSQDIDLLTTGVLALGNFARTDSHCIYMVEQKIMNKLLQVLSKNNGVKDDVRLQHALLSALRNLVIPKPNKSAVIQAGLVETILPMLEIHQPPVVFKLLGTLRMTVDGQEKLALQLLTNKTLLEQLVHWSRSSDYAGVTGESLRLMAWLVKHAYLSKIAYALPRKGDAPVEQLAEKPSPQSYDRGSLKEFIAHDGTIESMINMLTSQHLVMQNEALIALCIISVIFLTKQCDATANISSDDAVDIYTHDEQAVVLQDMFIKHSVGKKLAELIMKSSDSMTKEIVENLENFINLLKTLKKLVGHLEEHNINELLKSIPILTEYCTL